jgi:hypothetical protein
MYTFLLQQWGHILLQQSTCRTPPSSPVWVIYHRADAVEGVPPSSFLMVGHVAQYSRSELIRSDVTVRLCKVVGWRSTLQRSEVVEVKIENDALFCTEITWLRLPHLLLGLRHNSSDCYSFYIFACTAQLLTRWSGVGFQAGNFLFVTPRSLLCRSTWVWGDWNSKLTTHFGLTMQVVMNATLRNWMRLWKLK